MYLPKYMAVSVKFHTYQAHMCIYLCALRTISAEVLTVSSTQHPIITIMPTASHRKREREREKWWQCYKREQRWKRKNENDTAPSSKNNIYIYIDICIRILILFIRMHGITPMLSHRNISASMQFKKHCRCDAIHECIAYCMPFISANKQRHRHAYIHTHTHRKAEAKAKAKAKARTESQS